MSSDEHVRKYIESSDLVLMLGTFITDMSMGFYTAKLDRKRTVLATTERVNVQYHRYESIQFRDFLEALAKANITPKTFRSQSSRGPYAAEKERALRTRSRSSMSSVFFPCIWMNIVASSPILATRSSARSEFAARVRRNSSRPPITCRWALPCPRVSASPWPAPICVLTCWWAMALFK